MVVTFKAAIPCYGKSLFEEVECFSDTPRNRLTVKASAQS